MWAKENIWLSLGATSLRPLPYTVNPPSMDKVLFIIMGMMLYFVGGVIFQVYLSELSFIIETNQKKLTRPQITLNSQFPEGPGILEPLFESDPLSNGWGPVLGISWVSQGQTPWFCRSFQMSNQEGLQNNLFLFYLHFILIFKLIIRFLMVS